MGEKLEAAWELHHIQKCRDMVYKLMNDYYFDENTTLQDILNQTKTSKEHLISIIEA